LATFKIYGPADMRNVVYHPIFKEPAKAITNKGFLEGDPANGRVVWKTVKPGKAWAFAI
jgi:hypothetical protein